MPAEVNEWCKLATEADEKLKVAQNDVALLSAPCESVQEEMITQVIKMKALPKQMAAKSADLSQLLTKHVELTDV